MFTPLKCATAIICLALSASVLQAQGLKTHDNFRGKLINSSKWNWANSGDAGLDEIRRVSRGSLLLRSRAHPHRTEVGGVKRTRMGLRLHQQQAAQVQRMAARVRIDSVKLRGCPASDERTRAGIRLGAYWFNDGTGTEETEDSGNIWAAIRAAKVDRGNGPAKSVPVHAQVFHCKTPSCDDGVSLLDDVIGRLPVGKWRTMDIEHDAAATALIFKFGRITKTWDYSSEGFNVSEVTGFNAKNLQVISDVANCQDASDRRQPFVDARARVDWVKVNR